ncbi:TonB-dependent siderophore receptor [Lampropedia puyangensis]|uniref:TonB-dependent siderophore receptor n=1 Tax=Lampropedia puyangensis TaxID=1330072 RepID=A0A4S8FBW7_9BURK|nr:TonB-dependent receptor [Lampropedia puyangensis]THU05070.1 TonB-dependent siderophore receptor [Lampropedia puyangensis]
MFFRLVSGSAGNHLHAARPYSFLRPSLLTLAVQCALSAGAITASPLQAQTPSGTSSRLDVHHFNIAAGPLATALEQLARTAGVNISYDAALVAGKHSQGFSGSSSTASALQQLLAASALEATAQAGGFSLRKASEPVSTARSTDGVLPEVVVTAKASNGTTEGTGSYAQTGPTSTATGLGLTVRETPQSISVVTRQQLEDQNLLSLGQAAKHVTGIATAVSDIERTDIHARGFHVDNYQYDGVPTNHGNDFFGASTFDSTVYDRIEFVRGATGLMTGAGNPGAAVNLIRKRATSKTLAGDLALGLGSWQHRRGSIDLSTALNETGSVRGRVAASLDQHDAFMDRYHTKNNAILATVEADITPVTTVRIGVDRQAKRPKDVDWGGLPMFTSDGQASHWPRTFNAGAQWTYWNTTNTTVYAGLEHQLSNGWEFKADASRLKSNFESKLLYLLGRADPVTGLGISPFVNYSIQDFKQTNAAVQLRGPFELLGKRHEVAVGLTDNKSVLDAGNHANTTAAIGNFYAWDGSYPEPVWGAYRPVSHDVIRQTGLYGVTRLALTDSLKLIAGARYTRWKADTLSAQRKHNELTPYAGLVWEVSPTYSLYASYADIFQPQNYRNANGSYLDPVIGKSYEAGVKAAYMDGQLNAALAVFKINQDNVAVLDGDALIPGTTDNAYRGERGVSSKGFEAELSGQLHPSWNWMTGFSRTLAHSADGARLNGARPVNQLHLFSAYQLPGALRQLKVGAGARWQSAIYHGAQLPSGWARRDQGSFVVADLMLSYQIARDWNAQLNIDNLFDKTYTSFAGGYITYGKPRSVMLTIKYQLPD